MVRCDQLYCFLHVRMMMEKSFFLLEKISPFLWTILGNCFFFFSFFLLIQQEPLRFAPPVVIRLVLGVLVSVSLCICMWLFIDLLICMFPLLKHPLISHGRDVDKQYNQIHTQWNSSLSHCTLIFFIFMITLNMQVRLFPKSQQWHASISQRL